MTILMGSDATRDVVRYWIGPGKPARDELRELLERCQAAGGRVDESCIKRCWKLDNYLRKEVAAAPKKFVETKQLWRQTSNPRSFPVYRTTGNPFVVFTIYYDETGETVVTALHFGSRTNASSPDEFDQALWMKIVEPRLLLLAQGGTSSLDSLVEKGRLK